MKWAYSIHNKGKLSVLLMVIVGVVLINHFNERNNADKMRKAMTAMYQDRLMVESHIYEIALAFSAIREYYQESTKKTDQFLLQKINRIDTRIELIQKTQLTAEEERHLLHLADWVSKIRQPSAGGLVVPEMEKHISLSLAELEKLSEIQTEEGKAIILQTERIIHSGERFAELEMVALLLTLLLIQILIISNRSLHPLTKIPYKLN
ncbi:Four helix bundle sensory module for signal transduction [Cyclobacterium lianum]|uniref:Four helix bundle sensory module for signal transduction n=1 Tax=Cyclobacterium lianum TaxID=388280 RepID=A0A1M7N626_9BACT|nr:MCP four helix bundle domain-containing protein [Cyclobacterium lianum]SHM98931.1 Four helix bundle sensory module for signal transduction [Cyclobacterium lianum]